MVEGPSTSLTFLGIEIDTVDQVLRLPDVKLAQLKRTLHRWQSTKKPTKRELKSLIGLLNHAAAVVRPGRSFVWNLIENMKTPRLLDQPTRLTAKAKADIAWWLLFVEDWNGVGFFPLTENSSSLQVFSDASGSWGCGAFTETTPTLYFQFQWPSSWESVNIAAKELLPVVAGAALWGKHWENKRIVVRSDNSAAVDALNNRSASDTTLSYLLQCLFFFEAYFQFDHVAKHVAGRDNVAADALSRNRLPQFVALFPQGSTTSVELPEPLRLLLLQPPLSTLEGFAKELFAKGLASRTKSSYGSAQRRYLTFCDCYSLSPLPLSESNLCLFAAFLAHEGLQPQSISGYLSALRHLQITAGLAAPARSDWPRLQYVLKGVQRSSPQLGKRLPITSSVMRCLLAAWTSVVRDRVGIRDSPFVGGVLSPPSLVSFALENSRWSPRLPSQPSAAPTLQSIPKAHRRY